MSPHPRVDTIKLRAIAKQAHQVAEQLDKLLDLYDPQEPVESAAAKKEKEDIVRHGPDDLRLAKLLDETRRQRNNFLKAPTGTQLVKWAEDIEKLHRIDGRPYSIIEATILWAVNDQDFWGRKDIIQSGAGLRKHFDKLLMGLKRSADGGESPL